MVRKIQFDYEVLPWMNNALCTDPTVDPEWFFPDGNIDKSFEVKIALRICSECPVRLQCLKYAVENYPLDGIWGGLKPYQLKDLVNKRRHNERANNS